MKRILLCLDASLYSTVCIQYAAWIAKHSGAFIQVFHVKETRQYEIPMLADLGGSLGAQPYQNMIGQLTRIEEEKARLVHASVSSVFEEAGLQESYAFESRSGTLVDSVQEMEDEQVYDMIILGKRGENANFAKGHLGSAMERVIRSTEVPCFVCNREYRNVKKLLIAYDGSPSSRYALDWLALTEPFRSAGIHLVVVNDEHHEERCAQHLKTAEQTLRDNRISPTTQMLTGEVEQCLEQYVEQENIDLLIAGARGHSRLREFFIGSTTTELLRRCQIPVLLYR